MTASPVLHDKPGGYYEGARNHFLDWLGGSHRRVLEIGCGTGANAGWLREHGARLIVGVEPHRESARVAASRFDVVHQQPIETVLPRLEGAFDLVLCPDVLEHLVDPWSVLADLLPLCAPSGRLAVSIPNIRHFASVFRIAFGTGFRYEPSGIFDSTHLRFFTRGNLRSMLVSTGWRPDRWGAAPIGRLTPAAHLLARVSGGLSNEWLVEQWYVSARRSGT